MTARKPMHCRVEMRGVLCELFTSKRAGEGLGGHPGALVCADGG